MKVTKATIVQYIIETVLAQKTKGNEIKVFHAWFCDKWEFHPTAKVIANRCGISEAAVSVAYDGLCENGLMLYLGEEPTPNGKFKKLYTFGPVFDVEKIMEGKQHSSRSSAEQGTPKKKMAVWYIDKWPHIKSEAERLIPEVQKYVKFNSTRKRIAKLEGFKNAISTQIQQGDYKYIDFKIPSFCDHANALVQELNEYIWEHDLNQGLFPRFESLKTPSKKTQGTK